MNKDFRLSVGFFDHPKIHKLERRLGAEGVLALVKLFAFAAINKPDGVLTHMDSEDVAIASKWGSDPDTFVETLVSLRLLDKEEWLSIHDWHEHNSFAAKARQRSDAAKANAEKRWEEGKGKALVERTQDAAALPKSEIGNAPSPIPSPTPEPNTPLTPQGGMGESEVSDEGKDETPDWKKHEAFLSFWRAYPACSRKKSAAKAFERWRRLKLTAKQLAPLLVALEEDKAGPDWTKQSGEYIPAPEVWLNRKRWLDDLGDASPASNVVPIRPELAVPDQYQGHPWSHLWTRENQGTWSEKQHFERLAGRTAHFHGTLDERSACKLYAEAGLVAAMDLVWSHTPEGRMTHESA